MNRTASHRHAFSLIEMAVVLMIIAAILGFGISLGNNAIKSAQRVATQERLLTIKKAIEAYVKTNGHLPCPALRTLTPKNTIPGSATTDFGVESRTVGTGCAASGTGATGGVIHVSTSYIGAVPVQSLGLPANFAGDAWDNKFKYVVSENQAASPLGYSNTDATLTIRSAGTNAITTATNRSTAYSAGDATAIATGAGASYVVISHGPDGRGAYPLNGTGLGIACASGGEIDSANCDDSDLIYYDATYNDGDNSSLYFDDYILWGSNALDRPPIFLGGPGSCPPNACAEWCAPCIGAAQNIPLYPNQFVNPKLCKKIIVYGSPCNATCLWAGKINDASNTTVRCP